MFKRFFLNKHKSEMKKLLETELKVGKDTLLFNEVRNFGPNPGMVRIGDHCAVAAGVQFITNPGISKIILDQSGPNEKNDNPRIIVHDNCFIGIDSVIYPGVVIGPDAIIGAGSVVMSDVPLGMCACGNPFRVTCTVDFYASTCKRGMVPNYDPKNKQRILQKHFWEAF